MSGVELEMRSPVIGGAPNYVTAPSTVITSGPTAPELPAERLRTEEPDEQVRLIGSRPEEQWISFRLEQSYTLGVLALVGHNLEAEDFYRIRVSENPIDGFVRAAPSVEVAASNLVGAAALIDDPPDSADGSFYAAIDPALPTVGRWEFDVAVLNGAQMQPGAGLQELRYQIQRTAFTVADRVDVVFRIYDGGAYMADIGLLRVGPEPAGPVVGSVFFDSVLIADQGGGSMSIEVECSSVGGKETAVVGALEFRASTVASEYDTGMIEVPYSGADPYFNGSVPRPLARVQRYAVHIPREAPVGEYVRVDFQRRNRDNADKSIDVGVVIASPAWTPEEGMAKGGAFLWAIDPSSRAKTRGQKSFGTNSLVRPKGLAMRFEDLPYLQALSLFQRLDLHKGSVGAFLAVPLPDESPEVVQLTTVYGTLVSPDRLPLSMSTSAAHMGKTIEMVEKVGRVADG